MTTEQRTPPPSRADVLAQRRKAKAERASSTNRATLEDLKAARALEDANGICQRCESPSAGLLAVPQPGGGFQVECLDRAGCSHRIFMRALAA